MRRRCTSGSRPTARSRPVWCAVRCARSPAVASSSSGSGSISAWCSTGRRRATGSASHCRWPFREPPACRAARPTTRSIFILNAGEEFLFHMPQGMDMLSITFDRETFERTLEESPWSGEFRQWLKQPVLRVPERRLAQCRERLLVPARSFHRGRQRLRARAGRGRARAGPDGRADLPARRPRLRPPSAPGQFSRQLHRREVPSDDRLRPAVAALASSTCAIACASAGARCRTAFAPSPRRRR